MEQLTNIHNKSFIRDGNNNCKNNNNVVVSGGNSRENVGGSLSSGGSSSTSLDSSSDEPIIEKGTIRGGCLTRSASRVSRFRSAKEFFERLSSINNSNLNNFHNHSHSQSAISIHSSSSNKNHNFNSNNNNNIHSSITSINCNGIINNQNTNVKQEKPPLPDRPRSFVVNRYTGIPIAASNPTTTTTTTTTTQKVSSNKTNYVINISPKTTTTTTTTNSTITQRSRPQIILAPYNSNNYNNIIQRPTSIDLSSLNNNYNNNHNHHNYHQSSPLITRSIKVSASIEQLLNCSNNSSCDSPQIIASHLPRSNSNLLPDEPVIFEGDNVIIGNGSLLIKRNKQLKIKFDENSTLTYEYPSEEAMLAEPESPSSSPVQQEQEQQQQQQNTLKQTNQLSSSVASTTVTSKLLTKVL